MDTARIVVFVLLGLAAVAAVIWAGRGKRRRGPRPWQAPEPPKAGGTEDYSNPNAPKATESVEITAFRCRMSLAELPEEEREKLPPFAGCELTAEREGERVLCTFAPWDAPEETFAAEPVFLDALQALAARHDLARFNGLDRVTFGLPERSGAALSITYASGERVTASDNQMNFLPPQVVAELLGLFSTEGQYRKGEAEHESV